MKNFAAIAALAVTASAVNRGSMEMRIGNFEYDVQSIPQGKGQDHTLWSWGSMMHDGEDEIYIYTETVERTNTVITDTQTLIDEFWNGITSTEVSH